jgi:hypothetical protein
MKMSNLKETETPRTAKEEFYLTIDEFGEQVFVVNSEFARQLEIELQETRCKWFGCQGKLASAEEELEELREELSEAKRLLKEWYDGEYGFGMSPTEEEIERFLNES